MSAKRLVSSIAVCSVSVWALAPPAAAQTASSEGVALEDVIVSARRERENLQDVPISITAITADDIREKNITRPDDFNTAVPGMSVVPTSLDRSSVIYNIRGQGQILGGPDPAVQTYFNDVPTIVTSAGYLFDLESIQVLKGPQGTLFGLNSTGGAVLFVPQKPTNEFGGYTDLTVGTYGAQRIQGALNVPVIDDVLLVRFAVDANRRDGYTDHAVISHDYDNVKYEGYRLGVTFTPNDRLENYFLANYSNIDEHGAGNQCLAYNPDATFFPAAGDEQAACAAQQVMGPRRVNVWIPPLGDYIKVRNYAADNTTTIEVTDKITLKNILGYRKYQYKQSYANYGMPFPMFEYSLSPNWSAGLGVSAPSHEKWSEEIQLSGDSLEDRLHWQTGLFFDKQSPNSNDDVDVGTLYNFAAVFTFQSLNWKERRAAYGQATYDLTDKLNITVGARYTEDDRRQFTTPLNTFGSTDLSEQFSGTTWNVSAQYEPKPDTMLYATVRRGYKSGGFNNVSLSAAQLYGPEFVTDLEVGAKTDFYLGDVQARINIALFRSEFDHWQERVTKIFDTPDGPFPFAVVTNVAEGVVQGVDFEATIIPTPNLEISAFYGYLDPYFTSNTVDGVDYSEFPVAQITRHKAAATGRYLFGQSPTLGGLSVSASYAWQSARTGVMDLSFASLEDPLGNETPEYWLLNVRADWNEVLGRPLDLSVFCDNVTDKTYLTLMNSGWTLGQDTGQYGPPRMYGVSGRWRF